jgi:hypothetical protein
MVIHKKPISSLSRLFSVGVRTRTSSPQLACGKQALGEG